MAVDIRISTSFPGHRKTLKLSRRLGDGAVLALLRLWTHTRECRPDGILTGMDDDDIEIAAGWSGEPGKFVAVCLEIGWLDRHDPAGPFECHDWADHQPWAIGEEQRADEARLKRLAQVAPEVYRRLKDQGVTSISKADYEQARKSPRQTAGRQPADSQENEGVQPAPLLSSPKPEPLKPSSSSPEKKLATDDAGDQPGPVTTTERFSVLEFRNAYHKATGELLPAGLNQAASELCMRHPRDKLEEAFRVMSECGGRTFRYLKEVLKGKPKPLRGGRSPDRSEEGRRAAAKNVLERIGHEPKRTEAGGVAEPG